MSGAEFATNPSDEHCRYKAEAAARIAQVQMLTRQTLEQDELALTEGKLILETVTITV